MRVHFTSLGVEDQTRLYGGSQGKLFLVADGMGGHAAGERASSLAVDCVIEYLLNTTHSLFRLHEDSADEDVLCDDLKAAFDHCQTKYNAEVQAMPRRRGMGTTLTIAYVVWPRLYVVHVGDSRAYLFRGSHLEQITTDHTVAQQYVDNGFMSEAEAKTSRLSLFGQNTRPPTHELCPATVATVLSDLGELDQSSATRSHRVFADREPSARKRSWVRNVYMLNDNQRRRLAVKGKILGPSS